jgi:hypothetical protein
MNPTDARVAQKKATINKTDLTMILLKICARIEAKFRGKTQYPRTQTLWKKDLRKQIRTACNDRYMFPPSKAPLIVTTAAPHQTSTKTAAKARDFCVSAASQLKELTKSGRDQYVN